MISIGRIIVKHQPKFVIPNSKKVNWFFATSILIILRSQGCDKAKTVRIPPCIQGKIEAIQQLPKYNPPATVYRYVFGDKYVYLFSSDCCDQYNYVYDKDCNVICAPSGGITGRGDGRCSNFYQVASDETLIWKDAR